MNWVCKLFPVLLLLIPLSVLGAAFLALDDHPLIEQPVELTPEEVQRATRLFKAHDPRALQHGMVKTIIVNQEDLTLVSNYLVHLLGRGGARVIITDGHVVTQATVQLPGNPLGEFLNIDAVIAQSHPLPKIESFQIGQLPIPTWLAEKGLEIGFNQAFAASNATKVREIIHTVALRGQELRVTYQWDVNMTEVVRNALVSNENRQRLKAYHVKLTEVLDSMIPATAVPLSHILSPLFALARDRSQTHDPVEENRAVVVLLSLYINHQELTRLIPEADQWPQPLDHTVTLHGRKDFPRHFIISAALSMTGGDLLSNAVGLLKEVEDSRGGSGFSFTDLGADKAGTLFGQRLISPQHASRLQARLAEPLQDNDLMPAVSDLPEGLSEAEFAQRFGNIHSPPYNQVVAQIDERVAALTLYR